MTPLAHRSFAMIWDVALLLQAKGYWREPGRIEYEVANTVYGLFDHLAWADRRIHWAEYKILDSFLEEDAAHDGKLHEALSRQDHDPTFATRVPALLRAAVVYDDVQQTGLATMLVNCFENLGLSLACADSEFLRSEDLALADYIRLLRSYVMEARVTRAALI